MTDLTTAKELVKESLLGSEVAGDIQLSAQSKATFEKNAQKDAETGELFMGEEEFVNAIAPRDEDYHKIKREQYAILFRVADRRNTGKISMQDWGTFENLLAKPDAEYEIAFRLFDVDRTGIVKYDDLKKLYEMNKGPDSIPFDWNCEWATLYSGGKKRRHDLTYPQFSQMLRGLQGERIRQAFHHFDKDGDGYIEPEDFQRIILETARHKLSDHLLENLHTLCNISAGSKISYANVRAFQNMIREMDLVEMIIRQATAESTDGKITRTDFLNEAARITRFSLFTPMEADILFHFASLDNPSGRLGLSDFAKVLDASWRNSSYNAYQNSGNGASQAKAVGGSLLFSILESVHHFALGSLAGAFGAFMVYPIDLVKTRMQNQRSSRVGEMLYKNSWDCAKKVVKNEGFTGLYSGVLPQLIFTNPLEIVKIRLQVQGEVARTVEGTPRRSAIWIVRNLGLVGLYKGASACLLRDVPFSAIYFPTYNHLKRDYFGESQTKKLGILQLLSAGAIAGMPAAYLTTPCDVIKTRLQVEARKGESSYTGLGHAAKTIFKEEGFKAFFKGGPARILRSSPQFGFTLAAYEVLQGLLPMPGKGHGGDEKMHVEVGEAVKGVLPGQEGPLSYLRSRNALKIILDLDEEFGRVKVPGKEKWQALPRLVGGSGSSS
ncbi:mitochondrial carrier protein [Rutstroemia sp. NJR-2017a BBW]|nr:mitochondrial carrier protein [Rutstroemia sp. NJR-2017a BBW]